MANSKYYYDYTRNMGDDKKKIDCSCERNLKECICLYSEAVQKRLKEWVETRTVQMSECEKCSEGPDFKIWSETIQKIKYCEGCCCCQDNCDSCNCCDDKSNNCCDL